MEALCGISVIDPLQLSMSIGINKVFSLNVVFNGIVLGFAVFLFIAVSERNRHALAPKLNFVLYRLQICTHCI